MKGEAVSALREERGLRRVSGAEPQVVGLAPQTTAERRANTMKTYLLRDPQTVEPQKRPLTPPMNRKAGRVPPCAPSANRDGPPLLDAAHG